MNTSVVFVGIAVKETKCGGILSGVIPPNDVLLLYTNVAMRQSVIANFMHIFCVLLF